MFPEANQAAFNPSKPCPAMPQCMLETNDVARKPPRKVTIRSFDEPSVQNLDRTASSILQCFQTNLQNGSYI
jgi:hypothetical protein